jgi:hypothetical protein
MNIGTKYELITTNIKQMEFLSFKIYIGSTQSPATEFPIKSYKILNYEVKCIRILPALLPIPLQLEGRQRACLMGQYHKTFTSDKHKV